MIRFKARATGEAVRGGFTLLEVMVASIVMSLFVVLIAHAWRALGRPSADMALRGRLMQEAALAQAALAADLGGYLSNSDGRLGSKTLWPLVGRMQPSNNQLWLCFDGGSSPNGTDDWGTPDAVVVYSVQGSRLVRTDQLAGTSITVAQNATALTVQDLGGGQVQLTLTLSYRGVTETYTWAARDP